FELGSGSPMAAIGLTLDHLTADGVRAPPPPLAVRPEGLAEPSIVSPKADETAAGGETDVVAYIVPLEAVPAPSDSTRHLEAENALIDASAVLAGLMAARDVSAINATAGPIAMARAAEMGSEGSGVTGFYGPRAQEGTLLQPSEVLCAAFVREKLAGAQGVYELGCGLGLLSCLMAMRGAPAVGVERNGARLATAQVIAQALFGSGAARGPRLVKGLFPKALRRESHRAGSVALVTNLLGTASPEQQEDFVGGLRAFGAVLIDVQRFYIRRSTRRQIRELEELFTLGGFSPPKLAFDLGPDGRFVLFLNPSPSRRFALGTLFASLGARRDQPLTLTP
ncbi:MAG: hypothetical protein ACR2FH_07000, partial [Caulobacteraceae bacterium]